MVVTMTSMTDGTGCEGALPSTVDGLVEPVEPEHLRRRQATRWGLGREEPPTD
jgi:hypothetical protein